MSEFTLKRDYYLRLLRSKEKLACNKCGKELEIGDRVRHKKSNRVIKFYHIRCFDEMI